MEPDPAALHRAFSAHRDLDWADSLLATVDITKLHGQSATSKSLRMLADVATIEPTATSQFIDSLPSGASPYQLDRRVKSPESLARKIRASQISRKFIPLHDVLRYTALTESADDLVAAAQEIVHGLRRHGWTVDYTMHSYTDGSRYKGLHAYLSFPGIDRVEVQFHSSASVKVKETTTTWYQVERSFGAGEETRAAARQRCIDLSATLTTPAGLDELKLLGGKRVAVLNYSDSRIPPGRGPARAGNVPPAPGRTAGIERNDGITR